MMAVTTHAVQQLKTASALPHACTHLFTAHAVCCTVLCDVQVGLVQAGARNARVVAPEHGKRLGRGGGVLGEVWLDKHQLQGGEGRGGAAHFPGEWRMLGLCRGGGVFAHKSRRHDGRLQEMPSGVGFVGAPASLACWFCSRGAQQESVSVNVHTCGHSFFAMKPGMALRTPNLRAT